MKNTLTSLLLAAGVFALSPVDARTWTSSDGASTFVGKFVKYDESTAVVTVTKGFRDVTFGIDKLSESDRKWLKEQAKAKGAEKGAATAAAEAAKQFAAQKIGSKLKAGVLSKLDGSKFVDYAMTTAPEYYVVYYSASW